MQANPPIKLKMIMGCFLPYLSSKYSYTWDILSHIKILPRHDDQADNARNQFYSSIDEYIQGQILHKPVDIEEESVITDSGGEPDVHHG
jgi:hypothetical protein